MTGVHFKFLFILLFSIKILIKLGLEIINYSYIKKYANVVPVELKDVITANKLQEINSYNISKIFFGLIYFLCTSCLLLIFLFTPIYPKYTIWINSLATPYILKGLLFFIFLNAISWILDLPFDYYFHFRIEARYGFNKYSNRLWFSDMIKSFLVSSAITIVILSLIFSFCGNKFIFNWNHVFLGWLGSSVLVVLFMYLGPILLFPVFYKLKPINNEALKTSINEMLNRSGLKLRGIFTADESKKSAHANALINGIGRSKTIILFDNLLNQYSKPEILAVIGHEIGHGKKGHIFKLMGLMIIELFLYILLAAYFLAADFPYQAMGITKIFYSGLFLAYIFFFNILSFFIQPAFSYYSRVLEYEADNFSKQLLDSGIPLQASFRKLIANEMNNINPHPWYETFYYSHPTLLKRIKALNQ